MPTFQMVRYQCVSVYVCVSRVCVNQVIVCFNCLYFLPGKKKLREKSDQVYKVEINQHVRQREGHNALSVTALINKTTCKNVVALIVRKKWVAGDKIHHPSTFDNAQYSETVVRN